MTVIYIDSFYAIGQSTDSKPQNAPVGFRFQEVDSGRVYYWDGDSWNVITGGSAGTWNPFAIEEIKNKDINVELNTLFRTEQAVGLFAFDISGNSYFVPIGSANRYLKVNGTGNGFEYGDPAVTGSWDPAATEAFTNKTINLILNHIRQTTPHAGDLLVDNGTDFVPLTKGAVGQVVKVKQDGTVGWDTDIVGEGGTGGGVAATSSRPSVLGYKEGWYDGGLASNLMKANGILDGELSLSGSYGASIVTNSTRGKFLQVSNTTSNSDMRIRSTLMFMRNFSSYLCLKGRYSVNVNSDFYFGFHDNTSETFSDPSHMDSSDTFLIGKRGNDDDNFFVFHNAGTSNYSDDDSGVPWSTNPFTLEVQAVAASNKFQWRINDVGGTWHDVTTNIPRTNIPLCLMVNNNSATETDHNIEIYDIEAMNKLLY